LGALVFAKKGLVAVVMNVDLCRIVPYCESDYYAYFPLYPKPKKGAEYAFKLDLIVLLIPEYRVENDKVKIVDNEGKKLEINVSDLVADLIDHESLHMILYHFEGYSASEKLDNLDNLLRLFFSNKQRFFDCYPRH
jgi:hypothetical protein